VLRRADVTVDVTHEVHTNGIVPRASWLTWLREACIDATAAPTRGDATCSWAGGARRSACAPHALSSHRYAAANAGANTVAANCSKVVGVVLTALRPSTERTIPSSNAFSISA
jgi:hypothetical protein